MIGSFFKWHLCALSRYDVHFVHISYLDSKAITSQSMLRISPKVVLRELVFTSFIHQLLIRKRETTRNCRFFFAFSHMFRPRCSAFFCIYFIWKSEYVVLIWHVSIWKHTPLLWLLCSKLHT